MSSNNQSRVQEEGHKEDRAANNGLFYNIPIIDICEVQLKHQCNYKNIKKLKATKSLKRDKTKKERSLLCTLPVYPVPYPHILFRVYSFFSFYSQQWQDSLLRWNAYEFDNIRQVVLHPDQIWTPDVVLFNA